MTPADKARANAVPCEMVLYAYRKNNQGVVVSFVVHPDDMPDALATARIGSRWVGALVQVNDDETPVERKEASPAPRQDVNPRQTDGGKERQNWQALPPSQRAGIRINEATFAAYLREEHPDEWHETGEADACLKFICKIGSKRDLAGNHKSLTLFNLLDTHYLGWLAKERFGA